VENYGFSAGMIYDPGFRYKPPEAITVTVERLRQNQEFLRRSWGRNERAEALKNVFLWSPDDIDFVNGKPQVIVRDIWDYILVLFLIDLSAGRLKICAYPDCHRLKYFVKERRDQKYCSTSCKNTFHVNLFLANPENRKSWNADRRKARPKEKTARGGKS
jgi:hypothetical protein